MRKLLFGLGVGVVALFIVAVCTINPFQTTSIEKAEHPYNELGMSWPVLYTITMQTPNGPCAMHYSGKVQLTRIISKTQLEFTYTKSKGKHRDDECPDGTHYIGTRAWFDNLREQGGMPD